ncbi:MAG TPA: hypothetical protein VJ739_11000, partial [Gemmataceae bacterium]|nr:hypothetical protein [Gemmataceae bacterium]
AFVQQLHTELTDADLIALMRQAKECRDAGSPSVTCQIAGYDEDPRELVDIPEARAFCQRLVALGYVSFLDAFTTVQGGGDLQRRRQLRRLGSLARRPERVPERGQGVPRRDGGIRQPEAGLPQHGGR